MANVELVDELERLEVARYSDTAGLATALQGAKADAALPAAEVGQSVASLVGGKVPTGQLPSFVDDVLEFATAAAFPLTGEAGKIYLAINDGASPSNPTKQYRWGGSAYALIPSSPGTTDEVPEGANNKYFSAALARAVTLTTLALTNAAVVVGDTYELMFGKLQAQINAAGANATKALKASIEVAMSDETTALTTGTKLVKHVLEPMTITEIFAGLTTAQVGSGSGGLVTIDIKKNGASIFTTKLTVDNAEKTTLTAATPAVLNGAVSLAKGDELTYSIDVVGDGTAKGLKVYILGSR